MVSAPDAERRADMELLIFAGALVALDVAAFFFGYDSREASALDHHDRALEAIRRGDFDQYSKELAQIEREMLKGSWPGF
jgi:DNA-binding GntR family transcriptional regulator